jgi:hypothetical protein
MLIAFDVEIVEYQSLKHRTHIIFCLLQILHKNIDSAQLAFCRLHQRSRSATRAAEKHVQKSDGRPHRCTCQLQSDGTRALCIALLKMRA